MSAQNQQAQRVRIKEVDVEFTLMRGKLIAGIFEPGAEDPRTLIAVTAPVAEVFKAFGIEVPGTVQQPVFEQQRPPLTAKPLADVPSLSTPAPVAAAPSANGAVGNDERKTAVKAEPKPEKKGPKLGIWQRGTVKVAAGGKLKFIYPEGADLASKAGRLYLGDLPVYTGQSVEYMLGENRGNNAEDHPYVVTQIRFERPAAKVADQLRQITPIAGKIASWSPGNKTPGSGTIEAKLESGKKIVAAFEALEIEDHAIDPNRDIVGMDVTCKVLATGQGKEATYVAYCVNSRLIMTVEVAHQGTTDKTYQLGQGMIMDAPGVRVFCLIDSNTCVTADGTLVKSERKAGKEQKARDRVRWTRVMSPEQVDRWFEAQPGRQSKIDANRYPGLQAEVKAALQTYVDSVRAAYGKAEADRSPEEQTLVTTARVRPAHEIELTTPEGEVMKLEELIPAPFKVAFWVGVQFAQQVDQVFGEPMSFVVDPSGQIVAQGNALETLTAEMTDAQLATAFHRVLTEDLMVKDLELTKVEAVIAAVRAERFAPAAEAPMPVIEAPEAPQAEQQPAAEPVKGKRHAKKAAPAPEAEQSEAQPALAAD